MKQTLFLLLGLLLCSPALAQMRATDLTPSGQQGRRQPQGQPSQQPNRAGWNPVFVEHPSNYQATAPSPAPSQTDESGKIQLVQGTIYSGPSSTFGGAASPSPYAASPYAGSSRNTGSSTSPYNGTGGYSPYAGSNQYGDGSSFDPYSNNGFANSTFDVSQAGVLPSRQILPMVGDLFGGRNGLEVTFRNITRDQVQNSDVIRVLSNIGTFNSDTDTDIDLTTFSDALLPFGIATSVSGTLDSGMNEVALTLPIPRSLVGRLKIAENMTPIPTDRLFINTSNFYSVPLLPSGVNLTRFTPGIEKTFANGSMSFEARFPFAISVDNNIQLGFGNDVSTLQLGNFQFGYKTLLSYTQQSAWSGGVFVTIPTGSDFSISTPPISIPNILDVDSIRLLSIDNQSFHIMPFLGYVNQISPNLTIQGYVQGDFATRGDVVTNAKITETQNGFDPIETNEAGRIKDATLLHLDLSATYFIYRSPVGIYRGIAPTAEFHWTHDFGNAKTANATFYEFISGNGNDTTADITVGEQTGSSNLVNVLLGSHFLIGDRDVATVGYAFPITSQNSRQFDGELRFLYNRYW